MERSGSGTYGSVPLRSSLKPGEALSTSTAPQQPSLPMIFDDSSSINSFFFTFDWAAGNVWGLVYLLVAFALGAMGWHYLIVVVMAWVVTTHCFRQTQKKHMNTILDLQSALKDPDQARRILGKYLPAWVCFSQPEKTAWLQTLVNNLWPSIAEAVRADVLASVNPILEAQRPKLLLNSLHLSVCSLGTIPISIDGVSASLSGNDSVIDIYFHWNSNAEVRLVAQAVGGVEVEAVVCNLHYQSVARIFLGPHCNAWPCFGCFSVTFVGKPVLDFSLKAAKIPLEAIPGFSGWLRGFIEQMLSWSLTYPNRLVFPLFSSLGDMRLMERTIDPIGRLRVRVRKAEGIPETLFQTRRTYVQGVRTNGDARSAITKRTPSVTGKNPEFNCELVFTVYNAPNERIDLSLMADEAKPPVIGNMLIKDNMIGYISVPVDGLMLPHLDITKRLVNPAKTSANVGSLVIETEYAPFVNQNDDPEDDVMAAPSEGVSLEDASKGPAGASRGRSATAFGSSEFEPRRGRSSSAARLKQSIDNNKSIRGVLMVTIVSCSNLQKIDVIGSADPYVKLRIGNCMERTEHINDNLNPVFNVQKQMDVDDVVRDVLDVEVHDYDRIKVGKRLLGAATVALKDVFNAGGTVVSKPYQLSPKGTITLSLRLLVQD